MTAYLANCWEANECLDEMHSIIDTIYIDFMQEMRYFTMYSSELGKTDQTWHSTNSSKRGETVFKTYSPSYFQKTANMLCWIWSQYFT